MTDGNIIAFGLLTERDLQTLGPSFSRAWPVDEAPCFTQLLDAIDHADRAVGREPWARQRGSAAERSSTVQNPIGGGRR